MISYAGVPFVATILPVAATPAVDVAEALDGFDPHDVFGHLVAKLTLEPQPQRRAMRDRQDGIVHVVGQDGLYVEGIRKIDALVVFRAGFHGVGAVEDDVSRLRLQGDLAEQSGTLHALPFADATPAFDAVMTRDLRARRKLAQLGQRQFGG